MSLVHKEVEKQIDYSFKERKYIREANSKLNDRYMEKAPDKHPSWGIRFGQNYVDSMTERPNSWDHTRDKFDDIDICLKCAIRICKILNKYWNKKEPWWMKWKSKQKKVNTFGSDL